MKKTILLFLAVLGLSQTTFAQEQLTTPLVAGATVCGVQQGRLNAEQIIAEGRLSTAAESMQIASFTMTVYNERGIESYSSDSDQLTPQMIKSLSNTKDGESVKFSQVLLTSKTSTTMIRSKQPISIQIAK